MGDNPGKTVTILYFAQLREDAGQESETVRTDAHDAAQLYDELQRRHNLHFPQTNLRVAVNGAMCEWDAPLNDRDTVAFIPPVSGG